RLAVGRLQRNVLGCDWDTLHKEQQTDVETKDVQAYLRDNTFPLEPSRRHIVVAAAGRFKLVDGVLCRKVTDRLIFPVVPLKRRQMVLQNAHWATGHSGVLKTYEWLKSRVWWMGMHVDTTTYVSCCQECAKFNDARKIVPDLSVMRTHRPFERVEVDVTTMPKSKNGYTKILVFVDSFTKWVEAVPLKKDPTAKQVAAALEDVIIARHSVPGYLHSDRGSNLTNALMEQVAELIRMKTS
ncbi:MAG: transposase family protein, partial [Mesoflavibacter sp.]|nr:transposase family protein [Mesoflavibacter sp.]